MRRSLIICIFLFKSLLIAQQQNYVCYKANDSHINIRTEPNTASNIQGQLFDGDMIFVFLGKSTDNWLYGYIPKIQKDGYCYLEYFYLYKPYYYEVLNEVIQNNEYVIELIKEGYIRKSPSDYIFREISEPDLLKVLKIGYDNDLIYNNSATSTLIECVKMNYYEATKYLLCETKEIKEINSAYSTYGPPLFYSIIKGNYKMTELLLQYGADVNCKSLKEKKMFYWINKKVEEKSFSQTVGDSLKKLLLEYGYKD